jgi:hypothetical protein
MPSRLRIPTPCSPVTVPPSAIAASRNSSNAAWAAARAASSPGGVISSGCRFPSPAWAIVATVTPWRAAIAPIRSSMAGTFDRGTQTSSVSTGPSRSSAG